MGPRRKRHAAVSASAAISSTLASARAKRTSLRVESAAAPGAATLPASSSSDGQSCEHLDGVDASHVCAAIARHLPWRCAEYGTCLARVLSPASKRLCC